jgi:hypothetical protein
MATGPVFAALSTVEWGVNRKDCPVKGIWRNPREGLSLAWRDRVGAHADVLLRSDGTDLVAEEVSWVKNMEDGEKPPSTASKKGILTSFLEVTLRER